MGLALLVVLSICPNTAPTPVPEASASMWKASFQSGKASVTGSFDNSWHNCWNAPSHFALQTQDALFRVSLYKGSAILARFRI